MADIVDRYETAVALAFGEITHACPLGDASLTPCCGRTPFEQPRTDRMTLDQTLVTCQGVLHSESRCEIHGTVNDCCGCRRCRDEADR